MFSNNFQLCLLLVVAVAFVTIQADETSTIAVTIQTNQDIGNTRQNSTLTPEITTPCDGNSTSCELEPPNNSSAVLSSAVSHHHTLSIITTSAIMTIASSSSACLYILSSS